MSVFEARHPQGAGLFVSLADGHSRWAAESARLKQKIVRIDEVLPRSADVEDTDLLLNDREERPVPPASPRLEDSFSHRVVHELILRREAATCRILLE